MRMTLGVPLALFAVLMTSISSRADDDVAIKERIKAAAASITSVVINIEMSPPSSVASPVIQQRLNMRITVANATTAKAVAKFGPMQLETYQVDGMLYLHVQPGDSWRKMSYDPMHPPAQLLDALGAAKSEQISLLPDRQEAGVTVGVVQVEIPMPAPPGTARVGPPVAVTCEYDKSTYHVRSCANAQMSMTFTKYNDPSNTVALPPGAAGAVLIVTKTPAPAMGVPSPSPSASSPLPAETPAPPGSTSSESPTTPGSTPSESPTTPGSTPSQMPASPSVTPSETPAAPMVTPTPRKSVSVKR